MDIFSECVWTLPAGVVGLALACASYRADADALPCALRGARSVIFMASS